MTTTNTAERFNRSALRTEASVTDISFDAGENAPVEVAFVASFVDDLGGDFVAIVTT